MDAVVAIIASFTFNVTVAEYMPFVSGFLRMALFSVSVAFISFGTGRVTRKYFGFMIIAGRKAGKS